MQASNVSRHLKVTFERIMRDGLEQYDLGGRAPTSALSLGHFMNAQVHFAQAWTIADVAATYSPPKDYANWLSRRSQAGQGRVNTQDRVTGLIGAISGEVVKP